MTDREMKGVLRRALTRAPDQPATVCPDDNTIAAYLDSALPREQRSAFEEHASRCPSCREVLGLALSAGAPSEPATRAAAAAHGVSPLNWLWRPAFATAALALVAVVAALVLVRTGKEPSFKQEEVAQSQVPAPPAESRKDAPAQGPSARLSAERYRAVSPDTAPKETQAVVRDHEKPADEMPAASEAKGDLREQNELRPPAAPAASVAPKDAVTDTGAVGATATGVVAGASPSAPGPQDVRREAAVSGELAMQKSARLSAAGAHPQPALAPARSVSLRQAAGMAPAGAVRDLASADPTANPYPRRAAGDITFYRVEDYWVDGRCARNPEAPVVEAREGSPELRSLLGALPDLSALKGPGTRVVVCHDGKIWVLPEAVK